MKKELIIIICAVIVCLLSANVHAKNEWHEADYVNSNCQGKIEFVLPDKTRVDCLTDTQAIEYDFSHKWAEAIGQSLYYSAMTGKQAAIVLIIDPKHNGRYLKRLNKTIKDKCLHIDVQTLTSSISLAKKKSSDTTHYLLVTNSKW